MQPIIGIAYVRRFGPPPEPSLYWDSRGLTREGRRLYRENRQTITDIQEDMDSPGVVETLEEKYGR